MVWCSLTQVGAGLVGLLVGRCAEAEETAELLQVKHCPVWSSSGCCKPGLFWISCLVNTGLCFT